MIQALLNWKSALALVAIGIVIGTISYSSHLAQKIAAEERLKMEQWVEAGQLLLNDSTGISNNLVSLIVSGNHELPVIVTDEKDSIVEYINIDTNKVQSQPEYLRTQLEKFRASKQPIVWRDPVQPTRSNSYYYGNTSLLDEVRYYPLVQLVIVAFFIVITIIALTSGFRSSQNRIWAGMAKETAHQLGTPLSSLEGWVEMLKEPDPDPNIVAEMSKDVDRLRLVSDRFGKIGSTPHLELHNIANLVSGMVDYIRKRAAGKLQFHLELSDAANWMVPVSPPLFDWVIENLLKNALDAMEGKGQISVRMEELGSQVFIEVTDTGKGIPRKHWKSIFKPGFTTKKRGWGLGLSLSKRIIEQYHKGQLFVKNSEFGKGTTFRIVLNK